MASYSRSWRTPARPCVLDSSVPLATSTDAKCVEESYYDQEDHSSEKNCKNYKVESSINIFERLEIDKNIQTDPSNRYLSVTHAYKRISQWGCRHEAISAYFGDSPPSCNKQCDHCRNPKAVQEQVKTLNNLSLTSVGRTTKRISNPNESFLGATGKYDPTLYAGGKRGYGFERTVDDDDLYDGGGCGGDNETISKSEWDNFFKEQFSLRKGGLPNTGRRRSRDVDSPDEDCPLKRATSQRLPKCNWKTRMGCWDRLRVALMENHKSHHGGALLSGDWLSRAEAANLEYNLFQVATTVMGYRASVVKRINEIKKQTQEESLHRCLEKSGSKPHRMESSDKEDNALEEEEEEEYVTSACYKAKRRCHGLTPSSSFKPASELQIENKSNGCFVPASKLLKSSETKAAKKKSKKTLMFNESVQTKTVYRYIKSGDHMELPAPLSSPVDVDGHPHPEVVTPHHTRSDLVREDCDTKEEESDKIKPSEQDPLEEKERVKETKMVEADANMKISEVDGGSLKAAEELEMKVPTPTTKKAEKRKMTSWFVKSEKSKTKATFSDAIIISDSDDEFKDPPKDLILESSRKIDLSKSAPHNDEIAIAEAPCSMMTSSKLDSKMALLNGVVGTSSSDVIPAVFQKDDCNQKKSTAMKSSSLSEYADLVVTDHRNTLNSSDTKSGSVKLAKNDEREKKDRAALVVRQLTPMYKAGLISSKPLFKEFARSLTHLIKEDGRVTSKNVKEVVKATIKSYFKHGPKQCKTSEDIETLNTSYNKIVATFSS
ncbi:unnamed protein product [Clavelina lepadiformis]|uniref:Set2 Rpb1 interacting domain-containing protein n=1 Tax=Clavelina lepadiformis TaxID=159417 RepID=A0ABP0FX73_CLALP